MCCYNCGLSNERVVAFVNITISSVLNSNIDTGVKAFMCKSCINIFLRQQGIDTNKLIIKEVK